MIVFWSQGLSRFLFCPAFCCRTDYLQAGVPNSDAHLFFSWVFRWLGSANCFSLWSLNGVVVDGGGWAGSSRGCPLCMSSADLRGLGPRRRRLPGHCQHRSPGLNLPTRQPQAFSHLSVPQSPQQPGAPRTIVQTDVASLLWPPPQSQAASLSSHQKGVSKAGPRGKDRS